MPTKPTCLMMVLIEDVGSFYNPQSAAMTLPPPPLLSDGVPTDLAGNSPGIREDLE